jgi:RNA polymerase sigma factor (sigma-70 family)
VKPLLTAAAATEVADDQLVGAVREGSEEAFELLYRRYRPRIVAYVRGMVGDHARAEDIAQEAFMSALRGLRGSDQEISFRPWMYEIAKNASIDHLRRARRGAEVSIDSDEFSPQEEGRISQSVSGTDAEAARRKELESLQMAFGDLPPSQHQILVMRELEGLSYDRIGSRLGLTRGAVESQLFRARRTLRDGFDDIDTGERCARMRVTMEATADGLRTGMRERRRLTMHLRDCADCRRTAVTIGLDDLALAAARDRGHALRRIAGLLPLPGFLRRRMEDGVATLNTVGPAAGEGLSLAGKATAVVVAAALAAGGAGMVTKASGGGLSLPGGPDKGSGGVTNGSGDGDGGSASGSGSGAGSSADGGPGAADTRDAGTPAGHGPGGQAGTGGREDVPGRSGGDAVGAVGGAVGGSVGSTAGSVAESPGTFVDRTGDRVSGLVDQTLQDVTGGTAPRLPKPKVELPGIDVGGTGSDDGSSGTTLPDVGGLGLPQPDLQVQTPGVTVPETGVTVPGTQLRLP